MSVSKSFTKGKKDQPDSKQCRVTFKFDTKQASEMNAAQVRVAGSFNDWGKDAANEIPMKMLKDGSFSATKTLKANQDYEFKYVVTNTDGAEIWVEDRSGEVESVTDGNGNVNSRLSTKLS